MIHIIKRYRAITAASVVGLMLGFGAPVYAHDAPACADGIPPHKAERIVTKKYAKNLVRELLRREYAGDNLAIRGIHQEGNAWKVKVWRDVRKVATATVDAKTGNIHVETN